MSPTRVLAACLVAVFMAQNASAQSVTFKKGKDSAGRAKVIEETIQLQSDIEVKSNGQVMQTEKSTRDEKKKTVVTILSAKDGQVQSIQVDVVKRTVVEGGSRGQRKIGDELSGKSFILKKVDGAITATDKDGGKLDESMAKDVTRLFKDEFSGRSRQFGALLAGKSVQVGQSFKVPDSIARSFITPRRSGQKEFDIKACTITMKSQATVNGRVVALFDMVLKLKGSPNPVIDVEFDFKGTLELEVDGCWTRSIKLKGPVTISGEQNQGGMKIEIEGLGSMSLQRSLSYKGGKSTSKKPKLY